VQRVAERPLGERRQRVGGDDRVGTPGPGDGNAHPVDVVGQERRGTVGGHVLLVVGVRPCRAGPDLDVQKHQGVESALAVLGDRFENAVRDVVTSVRPRERQRGRLPEPVVL